MGLLTKVQIEAVDDRKFEIVDLTEQWGGEVRISSMSSKARDEWELSLVDKDGNPMSTNFRAKLVAACIVDEDGNQMFETKDVEKLAQKDSSALNKLYEACINLNKMNMKDVEEKAKN